MPKEVVKKDGRKEEFRKEKIVASVEKTGAPKDVAEEIASEVESQPEERVETHEIAKKVLAKLRSHSPAYADKWRGYDKSLKRLSRYKK